jgi:hypothetical protein
MRTHYCRECNVIVVAPSERVRCTICDAVLDSSAPPRGTYRPMSEAERLSQFDAEMSRNSDLR